MIFFSTVLNCCNSMSCAPVPSPCSDPCPRSSPAPSPSQGVRAAYWPSFKDYPASSINTSYFTHIYYAFLLPDPKTYKLAIKPLDRQKLLKFINDLRDKIPSVKTMLSIGGGGDDEKAEVFSSMAGNKSSRKAFINSSIKIAREYGFDGLDLDWEFPKTTTDMSNLGLLYKEWREKLKKDSTSKPRLLLTSAVYYASEFSTWGERRSYPGKAMAKYLDWISPMCFDYYGSSWADFTGAHAALYDPKTPERNTDYGIESWIKSGVPAEKIVMGLPIFGHTWKLQDSTKNGIGAPAKIEKSKTLSYSEVINFNREKKATIEYDKKTVSYYSYAGDTWIGYDDVQSIELKVEFARLKKLGGYFLWAIGFDKDWKLTESASCAWGK